MRWLIVIVILFLSCPIRAQFYTIRREQPIQGNKALQLKQQGKEDSTDNEVASIDFPLIGNSSPEPATLQCSLPLERDLYITSAYGYRIDPLTNKSRFHHGIDLRCNNDKVLSIFWGEVKKVGYSKHGLGNYVVLSHKVFEITYGHLEYVLVEKGDQVRPGMVIGVSGNTGRSTGPHLHLELKYRGKKCDPLPLLAFIDKTVKLQNKINDNIMNEKNSSMTALAHVQEAYSEEFIAFLEEEGKSSSEESALLFLELKEKEILTSEQEA